MVQNKKIAVLMSGGIDSSFVALYLKKQGFDIVGITFLQYSREFQKNDIERAKKVANKIGIPHFVFDIRDYFKEKIIDPFLNDYKKGITPNPCSFCNKEIKFGIFFKKAREIGADLIATGHYARKKEINIQNEKGKLVKLFAIFRAKDKEKDQSYFLWQLSQKELKKVIFPLGDFFKKEVIKEIEFSPLKNVFRRDKKEIGYKESQDICFVKNIGIKSFLRESIGEKRGVIFDKNRNKIGGHPGVHFFTIGQRAGLKISATKPNQEPLYVIKIDVSKNALIIGKEEELYKTNLTACKVNWILDKIPGFLPFEVSAKIRYRHSPQRAKIYFYNKRKKICKVKFIIPQRAVTPGQHIVFYKRDMLLGGGVIEDF